MDLTPNDVEQKAFTQALRGYQMDEVDDFLDEIVTTLRTYDQRLRDAQEKIRALETDAVSRGGDETTISRAILVAQRSADALLVDAKVEADRIRQTAMAETESLSAERDNERNRLQAEIDGMRDRVLGVREKLTFLASAVGGQVADMEAEVADATGQLQPEPEDQPETTEQRQTEQRRTESASIQEVQADIFPAGEMEIPADLEPSADTERPADYEHPSGDQPQAEPRSIDLSQPADDEDDLSNEEVASRVSARPWERG